MFNSKVVEARQSGEESGNIPVVLPVNRTEPILDEHDSTQVCIERYGLTFEIPLFDTTRQTWSLGVLPSGSPAPTMETMTSPDQYLYDYRDLADLMTETLAAACTAAAIPAVDHPEVIFDASTSLFTFVSTAAFRAGNVVVFSRSARYSLNTFRWTEISPGLFATAFSLDEETQPIPTLEKLSPVSKIAIKTNLNVDYELMPSATGNATDISSTDGQFLLDARSVQRNNESFITDAFAVGDGVLPRWHNMMGTCEVKQFTLSFFWVSHKGVFHELELPPDADADLKLHFRWPV